MKVEARESRILIVPPGILWLDIETWKVPAVGVWSQKLRWQTFMVGLVHAGDHSDSARATVVSGDESALIYLVRSLVVYLGIFEIRYAAGSHEFDEMVLRGRFTNARHAHSDVPGQWDNLDDLDVRWRNIHKDRHVSPAPPRGDWDCASKEVPDLWKAGRRTRVIAHCLADITSLIIDDPDIRRLNPYSVEKW